MVETIQKKIVKKTGKIQKKSKFNSQKIWKIQQERVKNRENIDEKCKLNSDKVWKIRKKSKANREKDMEIIEETQVEYRKDLKKYGRKAS